MLNIYGVVHYDTGLDSIERQLALDQQNGQQPDTVYFEFINIPPFTDLSADKVAPTDRYQALVTSAGRRALTIDGFQTLIPRADLQDFNDTAAYIGNQANGIFNGRPVDSDATERIQHFVTVSDFRNRLMARQLVAAGAGTQNTDVAFVGASHEPVADYVRDISDTETTYTLAVPTAYAALSALFRASSEGTPDPELFITSWLLDKIYQPLSQGTTASLPITEAGVRSVYRHATHKPRFNILRKSKEPSQLLLTDIVKILEDHT